MKKVFLAVTALLSLFLNTYAQPGKHNIDKVAAVVGNNIVLLSDLNQQYTQYLYQGNQPNPSIKCMILQQTLTQKLLKQQAEIDSVNAATRALSFGFQGQRDRRRFAGSAR